MKITDMTNLYVCYNDVEDFRILVVAWSVSEALVKAEKYREDSNLEGNFDVELFDENKNIDCDYFIY